MKLYNCPKAKDFLVSECWILSWNASVQRAHLYKKDVPDNEKSQFEKEKGKFRKALIQFIENELLPNYGNQVSEEQHLDNILYLSEHGTKIGKKVLRPGGYKIGVAQKLFNLQLKYLWCLGVVEKPPHCPVDRVMIEKTYLRDKVAWTKIDDIDEYVKVIEAMKDVALSSGISLAEWELSVYDRNDA